MGGFPVPKVEHTQLRASLVGCTEKHEPEHKRALDDIDDEGLLSLFASNEQPEFRKCMAAKGFFNVSDFAIGP
jgi:hypothetical protein